jgi:hypothetical protein
MRSYLSLILLNFVEFMKVVECSKFILNFNKFIHHSHLTVTVTKLILLFEL